MPVDPLRFLRVNHINQVIDDYHRAIEHYRGLYGATLEVDFRDAFGGGYNNCLLHLGATRLEIFSPIDPDSSFGRQHQRYGNFWHAVAWAVPRLEDALDTLRRRGIRVVNVELDGGHRRLFADPRDTFGLTLQLGDAEWPEFKPESPFGLEGLAGVSVAVHDAEEAAAFYLGLVSGARLIYRSSLPTLSASAVGLRMADYIIEFLSPNGSGVVRNFLERYHPKIWTATWRVNNVEIVREHFESRGVVLRKGSHPGTLEIEPADNLGLRLQFATAGTMSEFDH